MKTKFLSGRLFLEGIEIPVASATWVGTVGQDSQLSVQVPYTPKAAYLKPRTLGHFFWVDSDYDKPMFGFTGDLVAMAVVRAHDDVSIVLTFLGHTNYWSTAYIFNVTGLGKEGREIAYFVGAQTVKDGAGSSIFPEGSSGLYSRLVRILSSPPKSFPRIKGTLGGVLHLMEHVGGWYHGKTVFKGLNDFLSLAELRLKLMQQVLASPTDSTSILLLKKKGIRDWAKNIIGQRGSMVSFSDLLNKFFQFIFYIRAPIFAGPYFPETKETKTVTRRVRYGLSPSDRDKVVELLRLIGSLRAQLWTSYRYYNIGVGSQPSKHYRSMDTLFRKAVELEKDIRFPKSYTPCLGWAYSIFHSNALRAIRSESGNSVIWETWGRRVWEILGGCSDALERLLGRGSGYRIKKKSWTEEYPDRLGTVGIWPELIFSPPPKFNVAFPDFIVKWSMSRQFLSEPTRLMLRGQQVRKGDIFSGGYSKLKVYFAPDVPNIRGAVGLGTKKFARSIMPHERFTGIIPHQVQLPWANAYRIKAKGKSRYMQRLANYEYLKARYASRTGSLMMVFRPQVVPGLPMLIMPNTMSDEDVDKYLSAKSDEERIKLADQLCPDQYLGFPVTVQHVLSPTSMMTNVSLTHVRTHREQEEDLGPQEATEKIKVGSRLADKKDSTFIKVLVDNRISNPEAAIRRHLAGEDIIGIQRLRRAYGVETNALILELKNGRVIKRTGTWIGLQQSLTKTVIGKFALKYATRYVRKEATVYEVEVGTVKKVRVGIYKERKRKLSFEEMITPPWLDKKWHPENISETYESLFGTGSILDSVKVALPSDVKLVVKGEETHVYLSDQKSMSIREAVNRLTLLREIADRVNAVQFAEVYAERMMANIDDVFGTPDLEFKYQEQKYTTWKTKTIFNPAAYQTAYAYGVSGVGGNVASAAAMTIAGHLPGAYIKRRYRITHLLKFWKAVQGKEGFHSRAIAPIDDIFILVPAKVRSILGFTRDSETLKKLDTRDEKRQAVLDYMDEVDDLTILGER